MTEETKPNGNREFGTLHASIDFLRQDIAELKGSVTPLTTLMAEHQSRLDQHQRELSSLWRWKDGAFLRACALVSAAVTAGGAIVGAVVYIVGK